MGKPPSRTGAGPLRLSPRYETLARSAATGNLVADENLLHGDLRHRHGKCGPAGARSGARGDGRGRGGVPADERSARRRGHRRPRGLRPRPPGKAGPRPGRRRQRAVAGKSGGGVAAGVAAAGVHLAAGFPPRLRAAGTAEHRGLRNAREDDDHVDRGVPAQGGRTGSGVSHRRRAAGPAYRKPSGSGDGSFRDRGGRVRQRILRQAEQVHPLRAPRRGAEQPGVRPRGHLPGSGGRKADVLPSDPDRAPERLDCDERGRREPEGARGHALDAGAAGGKENCGGG